MQRLLVPDLARGTALLGIALANGSLFWMINQYSQPESGPGWSVGGVTQGSLIDAALALFAALFVHTRGLPMFATLLGFGFGLVVSSLYRKQYPVGEARKILVRRYGALALFGLAHMFLVFFGDIMTMYGFVGMLLAVMFTLSTKVLRIISYSCLGLYMLLTSFVGISAAFIPEVAKKMSGSNALNEEVGSFGTYFINNLGGAAEMLLSTPFILLELVPPGRHRLCVGEGGRAGQPGGALTDAVDVDGPGRRNHPRYRIALGAHRHRRAQPGNGIEPAPTQQLNWLPHRAWHPRRAGAAHLASG